MALEARLQERLGLEVQTIWSDDGIAIRLPEGDGSLDGVEELLFPDPEEVEDLVVGRVGQSSLFAQPVPGERGPGAAPAAAPARDPDPALAAAPAVGGPARGGVSRYGSFPILVETYRECLADVFDLPALREILGGVQRRELAVHSRRDGACVRVRELAPVRLRRRLHVRRRCARWRSGGPRR